MAALPDPAVLITVTLFLGGAVCSLARRRRTGPQILGMLLLSQVVFHAAFRSPQTMPGTSVNRSPGHPGTAATAQMLAFHLIAALATAWLLTGGEDTLFRLFAALRRVLASGPRILVVPPFPAGPCRSATGAARPSCAPGNCR